jgi:hypothetical protein
MSRWRIHKMSLPQSTEGSPFVAWIALRLRSEFLVTSSEVPSRKNRPAVAVMPASLERLIVIAATMRALFYDDFRAKIVKVRTIKVNLCIGMCNQFIPASHSCVMSFATEVAGIAWPKGGQKSVEPRIYPIAV